MHNKMSALINKESSEVLLMYIYLCIISKMNKPRAKDISKCTHKWAMNGAQSYSNGNTLESIETKQKWAFIIYKLLWLYF